MRALLFNLKENNKLKQVLSLLNVEIIDVDSKDFNKQLGYLLNKEYVYRDIKTDTYFKEEMIILDEFSDDQLDIFLKLLKSNNIVIPFKAIVTETNINWSCIEIRNNLIEEYLAIKY